MYWRELKEKKKKKACSEKPGGRTEFPLLNISKEYHCKVLTIMKHVS